MSKELTERLLDYVNEHEGVDTFDVAKIFAEDHQKIIGALKSIESHGNLLNTETTEHSSWKLTDEGREVVDKGSHEAVVFNAVPDGGISQAELMKISPFAKVGFSKAMALGWILVDKSGGAPLIKRKVEKIDDVTRDHLRALSLGNTENSVAENLKAEYKKRKLLQEVVVKSYILRKGPEFSTTLTKLETDLTAELVFSGEWKNKTFKPLNFDALGAPPEHGTLHPLMKAKTEITQIFLDMGFIEMPTNNYVESSFWNFDALYQPQQHPARDAQDTFYISAPEKSYKFPLQTVEKVKEAHEKGGYGSIGYQYEWKLADAQKNVLRTHTTAVTARMLYNLVQKGMIDKPFKFFSIDKVFRNESLDATHLAEFHQVEGIVGGRGISMSNLTGILYEFFRKLGMPELEFKATYNPYTEPSMEIYAFHHGLNKQVEIGNSGMFRPEVLKPLGVPDGINVLGWGLSLERPTMIKYGINNIRDMYGPKVDIKMVKENPICRMDRN